MREFLGGMGGHPNFLHLLLIYKIHLVHLEIKMCHGHILT